MALLMLLILVCFVSLRLLCIYFNNLFFIDNNKAIAVINDQYDYIIQGVQHNILNLLQI